MCERSHPVLRKLGGLGLSVGAAVVLAVAFRLAPAPSGLGTHQGLGLPPCAFLAATGIPCPSCGLTTAFAALAHGDLGLAARANPVGILLFALAVLLVPTGLWLSSRGIGLRQVFFHRWFDRVALALVAVWLGSWVVRLTVSS